MRSAASDTADALTRPEIPQIGSPDHAFRSLSMCFRSRESAFRDDGSTVQDMDLVFSDTDPVFSDMDPVFGDADHVVSDMDPVVSHMNSAFRDMDPAVCDKKRAFAAEFPATGSVGPIFRTPDRVLFAADRAAVFAALATQPRVDDVLARRVATAVGGGRRLVGRR